MAKAKAKSKSVAAKRGRKVEIPEGFEIISSGGLAPFWEPERQKVLTGEIKSIRLIAGKFKKKQPVINIQQKNGETLAVSCGRTALKDFAARAKVGMMAFIAFDGRQKVKGRKEPMYLFRTGLQKKPRG